MAKLEGNLSVYGLAMVAIGASIGSGIFLSPSLIMFLGLPFYFYFKQKRLT
jgi:L-asparagine transporter-like permease